MNEVYFNGNDSQIAQFEIKRWISFALIAIPAICILLSVVI